MRSFTKMFAVVCALAISLAVLPAASAGTWSRKTKVNFSAPFEVPGVGQHQLPAGTYTFKLMASDTDRHIVEIFNENEDHLFTTILAIPNWRLKSTNDTVITFKERAQGEPQAIRAWFYPGSQSGEEFVYPKSKAIELAKISDEPVLAMPEVATAEELKTVQVEAVKPTGEVVTVAEVIPPAELPHTGSNLPLLALAGLLSLAGAGIITKYSV
jgi:LPXTG-motif cell wall-anchored protein